MESPKEAGRHLDGMEMSRLSNSQPGDPSSAASLASTTLPLQVVCVCVCMVVYKRVSSHDFNLKENFFIFFCKSS